MEQVLLVVQVLLALGLIGMVLIQRSDSDGFGLSGGSGNNLMTGRAAANTMTRITSIFAALFILNSLALSVIAARGHTSSVAEKIEEQEAGKPAQLDKSGAPVVPLAGEEKGEKPAAKEKPAKAPSVPTEGDDTAPVKVQETPVKEKAKEVKTEVKPAAKPVAEEKKPAIATKPAEKKVKKPVVEEFDPNTLPEANQDTQNNN